MSKQAKVLLVISGLFTLAMGLSNVFVNIFLWKNSNSFVLIAQYNLMHYLFSPLAFTLGGWLSKQKNGIWSLRLGTLSFMLFFITILIFRDRITLYANPLGILYGLAAGFYWLAFQVLSFDFTSTQNRDTFNGLNGSITSISNAIAPFSAAFIIAKNTNMSGYLIVFAISLSLFVILILVSLLLRAENYGSALAFKKILHDNTEEWGKLRRAISAWGFRDVVILFLIHILIFQQTGSEMALGKLSLLSYLLAAVAFVSQQKLIKPKHRIFSLSLGSVFMFIAVIGLVFRINMTFLLFYVILDALFLPFFIVPTSSATFNILDETHEEDMRIEYIINKEIVLNFGRIISTGILIGLLMFIEHDRILNYFLLFIGCAQFVSVFFLKKLKIWEVLLEKAPSPPKG